MSSYSPSPAFNQAASYLSNASALAKVSNTVKLELYGLFKLVTVSPSPNTSRPSIFDMTGRAKWDAWAQASKDYEGRTSDAEKRYLDIARSLGWNDDTPAHDASAATTSSHPAEAESSGDEGSGRGSGGGMGVSVSVFAPPESAEHTDSSELHSLVLKDTHTDLHAFLQANPDCEIDARDSFGYTPLHLASDRGHVAAVEMLVKKGADKSLKDPDDFTALELASLAGHEKVIPLLQ
ncbi:ankyrin [Dentipellis sp. KUC8613]|nr:ankyrin [Dentipellis sp. KUC8613]